ncbi:hypothetical protein E2C01_059902 [Portunus trituberculatus]|uniref:Uncharacterized protein n=1 Tax=Portunus trituberculatus TaxID=210409 RepID=A0A5B7H737_PORTR|nr:hypothetical protein [Portunus trituberculatus]
MLKLHTETTPRRHLLSGMARREPRWSERRREIRSLPAGQGILLSNKCLRTSPILLPLLPLLLLLTGRVGDV